MATAMKRQRAISSFFTPPAKRNDSECDSQTSSSVQLVVIRTVAATTTKVSLRWRRKSLRGVMTSCQVRKDLSLLSECLSVYSRIY